MVTPLPRQRHVKVARGTATLDVSSKGRLKLGIGIGIGIGGDYWQNVLAPGALASAGSTTLWHVGSGPGSRTRRGDVAGSR